MTPTESGTYTPSGTITLTPTPASGLSEVHPYPNPVRVETGSEVMTFTKLPLDSEIRIFSAAGKHVRTLKADQPVVLWDLRNGGGSPVGSGAYVWLAISPSGEKKVGRMAVIR